MRRPVLETSLRPRPASTSHARVVDQLGQDIISGRFASGAILPNDSELAQRFHVSRTVLREALKTLEAKGLVRPQVRIGTTIRERAEWNHFDPEILRWYVETGLDGRLLGQLQEIRCAFEPMAAALAARNAGTAQVEAIGVRIETLFSEVPSADGILEAMLGIHATVAEASSNLFLQSCAAMLKAALIGHAHHDAGFAGRMRETGGSAYRSLADALVRRDERAAWQAMETVVRLAPPEG